MRATALYTTARTLLLAPLAALPRGAPPRPGARRRRGARRRPGRRARGDDPGRVRPVPERGGTAPRCTAARCPSPWTTRARRGADRPDRQPGEGRPQVPEGGGRGSPGRARSSTTRAVRAPRACTSRWPASSPSGSGWPPRPPPRVRAARGGPSAPLSCRDPGDSEGTAVRRRTRPRTQKAERTAVAEAYARGCAERSGNGCGTTPRSTTPGTWRSCGPVGQGKLTFMGASYGTYLGALYATLFPSHVRRMVFDSAVSPTRARVGTGTTWPSRRRSRTADPDLPAVDRRTPQRRAALGTAGAQAAGAPAGTGEAGAAGGGRVGRAAPGGDAAGPVMTAAHSRHPPGAVRPPEGDPQAADQPGGTPRPRRAPPAETRAPSTRRWSPTTRPGRRVRDLSPDHPGWPAGRRSRPGTTPGRACRGLLAGAPARPVDVRAAAGRAAPTLILRRGGRRDPVRRGAGAAAAAAGRRAGDRAGRRDARVGGGPKPASTTTSRLT
ncbi:hypothetical protein SROCM77S_00392 [Streptomyces rochei]